jgi:translation initiation factor IF-2
MDGANGAPVPKPRLSLKGLKRPPETPIAPAASAGSFGAAAPSASGLSTDPGKPRLSLKSRLSLKGVPSGTPGGPGAPYGAATPVHGAVRADAAAAAAATPSSSHHLSLRTYPPAAATPSVAPRPGIAAAVTASPVPQPHLGTPGAPTHHAAAAAAAAPPPSQPRPAAPSSFERQQHLPPQPQPPMAAAAPAGPAASPFVAASLVPMPSTSSLPAQSAASGDTQATKKPRLTLKVKALGGGGGISSSMGGAPPPYHPAQPRPAAPPHHQQPRPAGGLAVSLKKTIKIKGLEKRPGSGLMGPPHGSGPYGMPPGGGLHHARSAAPSAAPAPPRVRPLARPGGVPVRPVPPVGGPILTIEAAGAKRSSSGVLEIQPARAAKRPRLGGAGGSDDGGGDDDDDYVPPKRAPPPAFLARHASLVQVGSGRVEEGRGAAAPAGRGRLMPPQSLWGAGACCGRSGPHFTQQARRKPRGPPATRSSAADTGARPLPTPRPRSRRCPRKRR